MKLSLKTPLRSLDVKTIDFGDTTQIKTLDVSDHPLDDTLRFTVLIGWGAIPELTRGFPRGL